MITHYDTLGVDGAATRQQIRDAYRVRLQLVHPDRHQGASADVIKEAERMTEGVVEAFGVLSDDARRADYDRSLLHRTSPAGGGGAWSDPPPRTDTGAGRADPWVHTTPPGEWTTYPCPHCDWRQPAIPYAPEVTCERCATTFVFAGCRACRHRNPVLRSDELFRCSRCTRRNITPWAPEAVQRRYLWTQVRNILAMVLIPVALLTMVATTLGGDGRSVPHSLLFNVSVAFLLVCFVLFSMSRARRRRLRQR